MKVGKRKANWLGTLGLDEQYSIRTEEGSPGPMFSNSESSTEGGSGGLILPGFNASPADKPRLAQWQGGQCGSLLTVSG